METSVSAVNGVKITTDKNGNQHFEIIDQPVDIINKIDDRSLWQKFKDWLSNKNVRIYAKVRDFADPFGDRDDFDKGPDGENGIEIGIKGTF